MQTSLGIHSRSRFLTAALVVSLSCLRFCHIRLLWADEDYHLAASIFALHGKIPYRDFWYDKPPLTTAYYLLIGGHSGWPLRLWDAIYVVVACYLAYRLAHAWWGELEGRTAALLLAFFMAFYHPSAVVSFAADAVMIVPHLAAVYCAYKRLPVMAGIWAAAAFLANIKGVFVLAVCALWLMGDLLPLVGGFVLPVFAALLAAVLSGAWTGYYEQVWLWGILYAKLSPVRNPWTLGLERTFNWAGFHAALILGAAFAAVQSGQRRTTPPFDTKSQRFAGLKLGTWIGLSFAAVSLGGRFAPHYFLQLLPPMVIAASRGIALALQNFRRWTISSLLAILLILPLIRFGSRSARLAVDLFLHREPAWSDVAMDLDSQHMAEKIRSLARPGNTLFVWGYRPDLYVYTRLPSNSLFWDSQPLTGVPADRHLSATGAIYSGPAALNRQKLIQSQPTFIVDGLGLLNPKLEPHLYPELRPWLAGYKLVARTKLSLLYQKQ